MLHHTLLLLIALHLTSLLHTHNKFILTGGPCCGKTSVIRELHARGYQTCPEAYNELYKQAQADGTLQELLTPTLRQRWMIFAKHEELEAQLDASQAAFLDRGIPDAIFYGNYLKLVMPTELLQKFEMHRQDYDIVFFFEPLPETLYEKTEFRHESRAEALKIHAVLLEGYSAYNFNIIHVPFDSIEKRANFILSHVRDQKGFQQ